MRSSLLAAGLSLAVGSTGAAAPGELARGWAALRAMDCARCHGRDYGGWAAPSLIAAVRDGTRERFTYFVLEGDPVRGMPGYRAQPVAVTELNAIYAYLLARADGSIAAGPPTVDSVDRPAR